jgi:hypothetical protein
MSALPRINQCGSVWADATVAGARRIGPIRSREEYLVGRAGRSNGSFLINVRVPKDLIRAPAAGTGADLLFTAAGVAGPAGDGGGAEIVVSITVLPFELPPEVAAGEALGTMVRARGRGDRAGRAVVEEFQTAAGHPAIGIRRIRRGAPREDGRRAVSTGQAQALVVYRAAGALGVVTGACRNPADLNATAALVAGLVARMTVTAAAPGSATAAPAPGRPDRRALAPPR